MIRLQSLEYGPQVTNIMLVLITGLSLFGVCYWFFISPNVAHYTALKAEEDQLRRDHSIKKQQAIRLQATHQHVTQGLEYFPLSALKFVGIIRQEKLVWALVSQPDGVISPVRPGDYIGMRSGRVVSVSDHVILVEEALITSDKVRKKTVQLRFRMRPASKGEEA